MPLMDHYKAKVTITVELHSSNEGEVVSTYSATRSSSGASANGGVTPAASRMGDVIEKAVVDALAAEKSLRSGLANAEARRLK